MAQYNPPEGFLYDGNSGLYYTQIIARDENGTDKQVVTWFDAETGQYSQEVYPIAPDATVEFDSNETSGKRLPLGALIGIIAGGVVTIALIIGIVIIVNNRSKADYVASNGDYEEIVDKDLAEAGDGLDVNNDMNSDSLSEGKYPEETVTQEWIMLPQEGGRVPQAKDIENYEVILSYYDSQDATSIEICGVGTMESFFLCNPEGYSDGDALYRWGVAFSDKCGVIATGRAHQCGESPTWEVPRPEYFTAQLVYERNGEKVYEDIDLGFGSDSVVFFNVHIPDDVGVDFAALDSEGRDRFEVCNQIGPYKYDAVYAPVYALPSEADSFHASNISQEEVYESEEYYDYVDAEEYEPEYVVEEAGNTQSSDSSSKNSARSPKAGLPAAGFYRSDDGTVKMDIMEDGLIYYYSADSMKYEGWYTYDSEGSGYSDQGGIYNLHIHYGTPDGELKMEVQIDTEVSGLQVLSGPGDYGSGWLWLG